MPLYAYLCPKCEARREEVLPLARYADPVYCPQCFTPMTKQLGVRAGIVKADLPAYRCPITDKVIDGRKAHEANLARHGCRVAEAGETDAARRRAEASDRELDALAETMAVEGINAMPERKFQTLAAELEKGGDALVERL